MMWYVDMLNRLDGGLDRVSSMREAVSRDGFAEAEICTDYIVWD